MSWLKIVKGATPTLIVLLLIAYFADGWKAFPMAIVAWGTILLAFSTWLSIRSSNERETQRINNDINRERRQRDKTELDDIKEWALRIASCRVPIDLSTVADLKENEQARRYECAI